MKIKYFGHATFLIDDLLIDPFIKDNPHTDINPADIKCNVICITHKHMDHDADALEIAKANDAPIVAIHELTEAYKSEHPKVEGMNIGGWIAVGGWEIKMVNALHSSEIAEPCGFILKKDGKTIYHAGDTGLFGDMKLIGEEGIDIAMLPIGDRYTMDIKDAIKAAELIKPKVVIPMHYNTFPVIQADPEEFKKQCPVNTEVFQFNEEKDL